MANGLRKSKAYLAKNIKEVLFHKNHFVCYAIIDAYTDGKMDSGTKQLLIDWIENQIYGTKSVMQWLAGRDNKLYSTLLSCDTSYTYRHAWVDHMIKVLES